MSTGIEDVKKMMAEDALSKHVSRFAGRDGFFSAATVTEGLRKINGYHPTVKGPIIAAFNGIHAASLHCPYARTETQKDYSWNLHLGTTRIWNADGSINEDRWQKLTVIADRQKDSGDQYITLSALKKYLADCYARDPQEQNTGRNTHSIFSSGYVQATAATQAWNEVFDRLTCGWVLNESGKDLEPFIDLTLVRLFFENSDAAFLKAEQKELPKPKPAFKTEINTGPTPT